LRDEPAASGIDVVIAAMIAPVSSYAFMCSVIAARITSRCHSNGIARRRTQSRHQFSVSSIRRRPVSDADVEGVSSGPISSVISSVSSIGRSSVIAVIEASVVIRSVSPGIT
jgi:hypothetical protein